MKDDYSKLVANYVTEVIVKYWKRKSIFEPLSKLLPEYWQDIFLRAVKEVMFEKTAIPGLGKFKDVIKRPYIWQLRHMSECPANTIYVEWVAQKIIDKEKSLRKMVWYKNQWKNPYPPRIPINFFVDSFIETNELFKSFKARCEKKMAEYVQDEKLREELLLSIYLFGNNVKYNARRKGLEEKRKQFVDKINWIINELELKR